MSYNDENDEYRSGGRGAYGHSQGGGHGRGGRMGGDDEYGAGYDRGDRDRAGRDDEYGRRDARRGADDVDAGGYGEHERGVGANRDYYGGARGGGSGGRGDDDGVGDGYGGGGGRQRYGPAREPYERELEGERPHREGYGGRESEGERRREGYGGREYEGERPRHRDEAYGGDGGNGYGGGGRRRDDDYDEAGGRGRDRYGGGGGGGGADDDDDDDDPDFESTAMRGARQHGASDEDATLFSSVLSSVNRNRRAHAYDDATFDESDAMRSHDAFYGSGRDRPGEREALGDSSIGQAAAMEALKTFTSGGGAGGGGASGGKADFVGLAMSQASRLFEQQSRGGNLQSGASKEKAISSAAELAMRMYLQNQKKRGETGGPEANVAAGLIGLASKFLMSSTSSA